MKKMHFSNAFHLIQLAQLTGTGVRIGSTKIIKIKINVF